MNENFKKFKKKVWIDILIKCLVAALLTAFVAVNAVLLPCKLFGADLLWVYYLLIGLGGFLTGGGIAFLVFRTTDRKIAKRIDSELNLSERVQTAYEFSGAKSEMLELQKTDAVKSMSSLPALALPFKGLLATILCAAIAVAGIVAVPVITYAVPPVFAADRNDPTKPVDPPRDITDWEWAALDDLIKYVSNSKIADTESKSLMLSELQGLRSLLLSGVSQSSLPVFVRNTVNNITNGLRDINDKYPPNGEELHPQAVSNNEEATYVINKLYEIFSLPTSGGDNTGGDDKKDDEGDDPSSGNTGSGNINLNDTPFFDPELGFVIVGEVRGDYYLAVQKALEEGVISPEEWEYIMVTYFADLGVKDED